MSSQVSPESTPPPAPSHFTPRPTQDPPGMSALFVAVTVVCALGASSILVTTRDGFGLAGVTSTLDTIFASMRSDAGERRPPRSRRHRAISMNDSTRSRPPWTRSLAAS